MLAALGLAICVGHALADCQEPYPELHSVDLTGGPAVPTADDPLVRAQWQADVNISELQIYRVKPTHVTAVPPSAFLNVDSLLTDSPNVTVLGNGSLVLDFSVERAAWIEFDSPDLGQQASSVRASISEYNFPWQGKTRAIKQYGSSYRLETNPQLYEGVRFAWVFFEPPADANPSPWHITRLQAVAQTKAVNYSGSFHSPSEKLLEQVWYTGAYAVRLNMNGDNFGSILMDRGDRVSIQGDGHPTMATGLAAFGGPRGAFPLVKTMLNKTDSGCKNCHVIDSGLMPYPIYWSQSVMDYFWASGDTAGFLHFVPDMRTIIDAAVHSFGTNPNVAWFGWDDRVANGFCGKCNREAQLGFQALVVRACRDLARAIAHAGGPNATALAAQYNHTATMLAEQVRTANGTKPSGGGWAWYADWGLHASADAVNAGIPATDDETTAIFEKSFTDAVTVCSWSPFNQYWILQALGNMNKMDYALASIRMCWGTQLQLGKGCFYELYSPEWSYAFQAGDKFPTRPSYCHPWSAGVTAWMTHVLGGVRPLLPGYYRHRDRRAHQVKEAEAEAEAAVVEAAVLAVPYVPSARYILLSSKQEQQREQQHELNATVHTAWGTASVHTRAFVAPADTATVTAAAADVAADKAGKPSEWRKHVAITVSLRLDADDLNETIVADADDGSQQKLGLDWGDSVVGLRAVDEGGCELLTDSVTVEAVGAGAGGVPLTVSVGTRAGVGTGELHPSVAAAHRFVPLKLRSASSSSSSEKKNTRSLVSVIRAAYHAPKGSQCAQVLADHADVQAQAHVQAQQEEAVREEGQYQYPTFPPFKAPVWPASATADTSTQGDWVGKYGKDGYYILGFAGKANDSESESEGERASDDFIRRDHREHDQDSDTHTQQQQQQQQQQAKPPAPAPAPVIKLPSWVRNVTQFKRTFKPIFVGSGADGAPVLPSYLQDPDHPTDRSKRRLYTLGDECSDGCQGNVWDINVSDSVDFNFTISVYAVDTLSHTIQSGLPAGIRPPNSAGTGASMNVGAQQAIRAMDLESLNVIAPLRDSTFGYVRQGPGKEDTAAAVAGAGAGVGDWSGGVYWRLRYDRSIRLRIMPIYGGAQFSAIFFDRE
eukprot:g556.t1